MANLDVKSEQDGPVTVLHVTGKLVIDSSTQLRAAVQETLEEGQTKIVLDVGGLTRMDSSGIGELVSSYTTVTNRGGTLVLANVPPKILDVLSITQLITVFGVYDSTSEAVAALS